MLSDSGVGVDVVDDVAVDDNWWMLRVWGYVNCCCNVIKLSSSSEIWTVSGELLFDLSEVNGE